MVVPARADRRVSLSLSVAQEGALLVRHKVHPLFESEEVYRDVIKFFL